MTERASSHKAEVSDDIRTLRSYAPALAKREFEMHRVKLMPALIGAFTALTIFAADKPKSPQGPANRLAKESSPYLRQHAHNPVDWYPWGLEAFEKAKKENKLVFLSIGYSSCHWCHVMERESFSNAAVAKILNDSFVCIKVDREERPDIDEIYMAALHVFGQNGGWPLSMFLTADAKPIIGGTYWPPDDKEIEGQTVRGFKTILKIVLDVQKNQNKELIAQADKVAEVTQERLTQSLSRKAIAQIDRKLIEDATKDMSDNFDEKHGGFGRKARQFAGPKFPTPTNLELLLAEVKRTKNDALHKHLKLTLEQMAKGGIFDHLGGGFHRYTVERTWTVPHFEKMLYDNAQLVEIYAKAHEFDPNPLYDRAIRATLEFVTRELMSPDGGFYSALDADSEGEEGRFYVWTPKDLEQALENAGELQAVREVFGVSNGLNFENKYSILTRNADEIEAARRLALTPKHLAERIESARRKLFDSRAKRERPFLDTKVITAWNGQMIAAYARAGRVLKEPAFTATAVRAADFVLKNLRIKDGRLLRTYMTIDGKGEAKLNGYLDDYAFFVHGLLALHETTNEKRWLDEAKALTDTMIKWHHDEKIGGFFYTSHDHEKLFARSKDQYDGAQPSGNSMAVLNLVRLAKITGEKKYLDLANRTFETFLFAIKESSTSLTTMLVAIGEYLDLVPKAIPKPGDLEKPGKAKKSDSVVKVTMEGAKPDADGKQIVMVTLDIEADWYTYANPVGNKEFEGTETTVKVAGKGNPKLVSVDYPKGKAKKEMVMDQEIEYQIYEGKVTIKATVQRAAGDAEPIEVSARFGACNKKGVCLLPATVTIKVP